MGGGAPFLSGRCPSTQITIATARITVPARRRKTLARSTRRSPSDRGVGQRYGGISSMKEERALLRIVDLRSFAVPIAARNPIMYRLSSASTWYLGAIKAAITSVYTGNRAEQVRKGAIKIVAMRSRLFSMVRVAMIAGTAQA